MDILCNEGWRLNSTTSSSFMWRSTTSPGWGEGETQGERSGGKVRGRKRGREKRSARGQGDMCVGDGKVQGEGCV